MEKYRSVSCRDGNHGVKAAPTSMEELRSHSVSYYAPPNPTQAVGKVKMKKSNDVVGSFSFSKSWSLNDAELQRKRRITGYKAYAMKGKMKGSLRKSVRCGSTLALKLSMDGDDQYPFHSFKVLVLTSIHDLIKI